MTVDLDRLEVLLGAATSGEWQERIVTRESRTFRSYSRSVEIHNGPNHVPILSGPCGAEPPTDDARLVVALRNAAPELLAELRAAREEIGKLRVDLTELEMWRAIQCATIRLADAVPGDGATEET